MISIDIPSPQKILGNTALGMAPGFLLDDVDEVWAQHLPEFILQNDVLRCFIGKDQLIACQLPLSAQISENGNERRHPGTTGNESTRSLVIDGAENIFDEQLISCLQMAQLLGHTMVIRIGLDHELQVIIPRQTDKGKGPTFIFPARLIDRHFSSLTRCEFETLRFLRADIHDVMRFESDCSNAHCCLCHAKFSSICEIQRTTA